MTTVRHSQRDLAGIALTIESGHNFTAASLKGVRNPPNRYVIWSYNEVIAVLNLDATTALVSIKTHSPTTSRHQHLIRQVVERLGFAYATTSMRLNEAGDEIA